VYLFSAVPCKINYQGRLIKDNVPVDGTKKMVFSIYPDAVGGDELWTSGEVDVTVHNGLFRYVLDLSSIDNWTAGETLYLEVQIGTDILTPREAIYAYPYAINSHLLGGKTTDYFLNTSGEEQTKQGDLNIIGNVGIGTTSPNSKLDVSGAIKYSGSYPGTILYGRTSSTGTPTSDGFRVRYDGQFWGTTRDVLIIEKTDGNADSPDGGIAFVNTGQDGIEDTAMVIRGNGNVGIGTTSPETPAPNGNPGNLDVNDIYLRSIGQWVSAVVGGGAYIKVSDQVPSGVGAQANASGTWTTKRINTENHDDGGYASISDNQITLTLGTYRASISSPVRRNCRLHKARLRNITDDVTTLVGTSEDQHDDYSRESARSFISGQFTISATTVFEIQHYKQSGSGWGLPTNVGEVEVYTVAEFWKVR